MIKHLLAFIFMLFLMNSALAVRVSSLYQAELSVASQSSDERDRAIKAGLLQVLIKLTGDSQIDALPVIQASLRKAGTYVEEFSYLSDNVATVSPTIHIRYNNDDINRLLKKAGVAYWGENRPLILIWLAITETGHETTIVGNESPSSVLEMMKHEGKRSGLPMIFPVMDIADISQVTPESVNDMVLDVLKEAGKRYSPDAFLIGKMTKNEHGIQSAWQLIVGNDHWNWTFDDKTTDGMLSSLLKQVTQALAKHYAIKTVNSPEAWVTLQISHVANRQDLLALTQYLKQLTAVQQVELSQISGDTVELAVLIRGSSSAFQENAAIGQHFILKSSDEANQKWIYEWVH